MGIEREVRHLAAVVVVVAAAAVVAVDLEREEHVVAEEVVAVGTAAETEQDGKLEAVMARQEPTARRIRQGRSLLVLAGSRFLVPALCDTDCVGLQSARHQEMAQDIMPENCSP